MFGLFSKKTTKLESIVAPEVGATLQAHSTPPEKYDIEPGSALGKCKRTFYRGVPPNATWAAEEELGETEVAYMIPASGRVPGLSIGSGTGDMKRVEIWELSGGQAAQFSHKRQVNLDPNQNSWVGSFTLGVSSLPDNQAAVVVHYDDPRPRTALYLYNAASNQFRSLGRIAPDGSNVLPSVYTENLAITPNTMLLLYYTDEVRLAPENYAPQFNRIMLFSPRHPQGLEVLKLSIDDGNIRGWGMVGKTLWLQSTDKRKTPRDFTWSLDLSKVL